MTTASKNFSLSQAGNILGTDANGAVTGVKTPSLIQNDSTYDVRLELNSSAGILQANVNGNITQFLPGGTIRIPTPGAIYAGTFDGSQLTLDNNQVKLKQMRSGNVQIQLATDGANVTKTWAFNQDGSFAVAGNITGATTVSTVNLTATGTSNLGAVGNITITGGSNTQVLTTNGSGGLSWSTPAAGGNASYVTGQLALFSSGPPDNTWLKTEVTYNSNVYPNFAPMWATYSATNSATSTAWGWGNSPSIFYGGGRYIGIEISSAPGAKRTKYSTDGVNWTNGGTLPNITTGKWADFITWNGSVFCVINYSATSRIAATSPDGVTWTQRTLPAVTASSSGWYSVTSLGSTLIAAEYTSTGTTTQVAASTDNGATWTTGTIPFTTVGFVSGSSTRVIAVKQGSNLSAYSDNGTTWTQGNNLPGAFTWTGGMWNGKYWLVNNATGASMVAAKSYDGIGWMSVNMSNDIQFVRSTWTGKHWLIYFNSGGVLYYAYDPTAVGWQSGLTLSRSIPSAYNLATDGTGNSFIVYDSSQDRVYTYTMTIASTFYVNGPSGARNDWFIKM